MIFGHPTKRYHFPGRNTGHGVVVPNIIVPPDAPQSHLVARLLQQVQDFDGVGMIPCGFLGQCHAPCRPAEIFIIKLRTPTSMAILAGICFPYD